MKAVWLENKVLRFRRDVPKPLPSEDEALIAVRLAGICGTDLQLINGYYPFSGIPGHEFVGEIIEAPQQPQRVGERVVGEINITCGTCNSCRQGHPTHCETRSVLGIIDHPGVFAEYVCLPLKNLIPVPDSVSDEAAVFVEPLAAALQIQQQITINSTDRILLVGAGRLGQLIAQTLILTKGNLQVVARYKNQRKLLKKHKINWLDESSVPRGLFDIVIEATGSGSGFSVARQAVRPGGLIVLKSTYADEIQVNFSSLVVDEITLIGSRCGPFRPAIDLLESKQVDPAVLIDHRYAIEDAIKAFEHAQQFGALKILFEVSGQR